MNEELQRAISAGLVVMPTPGIYRCVVCEKDGTEMVPHLRGKDHSNNLAWEGLSNRAPHSFLLDAIPPVVREARERNELELVDKTVFSYRCLVCPRRPISSGIKSLETHLKGKEHEKAKKNMSPSLMSPLAPISHPSSSSQHQFPPSISSIQLKFTPRNPGSQPFPREQTPSHLQHQYPQTDSPQRQHDSFNLKPFPHQTPASQPHMAQYYTPSQQQLPPLQAQYSSTSQPSPSTLPHTSATGAPRPNSSLQAVALPSLSSPSRGDVAGTPNLDPELQHALENSMVVKGDGYAFTCRVCDKNVTGPASCLEHLKSDKHKRKALAWSHQQLPDIGPLSLGVDELPGRGVESLPVSVVIRPQPAAIPSPPPPSRGDSAGIISLDPELQHALENSMVVKGDGHAFTCRVCEKKVTGPASCLEHLRSDKHRGKAQAWTQQQQFVHNELLRPGFDALPIREGPPWTAERHDQVDGLFPRQVPMATQPFQPSNFVYRNLAMPRGLVLIFNYYFSGHEHERHGAKQDSTNLEGLFHRMGYHVYLYEDYSKSKTEQTLTYIQNNPFLKDYDSFIVFVMSHGKNDHIFYTASGREEDCMELDTLRYKFTDIDCPFLKGKPKLFFVSFCRGTNLEASTAYDSISLQRPGLWDAVTLYSCINHFKTPRHPERGTFFVQAWCEVLAAHAYNEELRDLHRRVCRLVREMRGSTPELQEYDFKKFYFNPIYTQ